MELRKSLHQAPEEKVKVMNVANDILKLLTSELLKRNYRNFDVTIQGSVAKDTWLPGGIGISISLLFYPGIILI